MSAITYSISTIISNINNSNLNINVSNYLSSQYRTITQSGVTVIDANWNTTTSQYSGIQSSTNVYNQSLKTNNQLMSPYYQSTFQNSNQSLLEFLAKWQYNIKQNLNTIITYSNTSPQYIQTRQIKPELLPDSINYYEAYLLTEYLYEYNNNLTYAVNGLLSNTNSFVNNTVFDKSMIVEILDTNIGNNTLLTQQEYLSNPYYFNISSTISYSQLLNDINLLYLRLNNYNTLIDPPNLIEDVVHINELTGLYGNCYNTIPFTGRRPFIINYLNSSYIISRYDDSYNPVCKIFRVENNTSYSQLLLNYPLNEHEVVTYARFDVENGQRFINISILDCFQNKTYLLKYNLETSSYNLITNNFPFEASFFNENVVEYSYQDVQLPYEFAIIRNNITENETNQNLYLVINKTDRFNNKQWFNFDIQEELPSDLLTASDPFLLQFLLSTYYLVLYNPLNNTCYTFSLKNGTFNKINLPSPINYNPKFYRSFLLPDTEDSFNIAYLNATGYCTSILNMYKFFNFDVLDESIIVDYFKNLSNTAAYNSYTIIDTVFSTPSVVEYISNYITNYQNAYNPICNQLLDTAFPHIPDYECLGNAFTFYYVTQPNEIVVYYNDTSSYTFSYTSVPAISEDLSIDYTSTTGIPQLISASVPAIALDYIIEYGSASIPPIIQKDNVYSEALNVQDFSTTLINQYTEKLHEANLVTNYLINPAEITSNVYTNDLTISYLSQTLTPPTNVFINDLNISYLSNTIATLLKQPQVQDSSIELHYYYSTTHWIDGPYYPVYTSATQVLISSTNISNTVPEFETILLNSDYIQEQSIISPNIINEIELNTDTLSFTQPLSLSTASFTEPQIQELILDQTPISQTRVAYVAEGGPISEIELGQTYVLYFPNETKNVQDNIAIIEEIEALLVNNNLNAVIPNYHTTTKQRLIKPFYLTWEKSKNLTAIQAYNIVINDYNTNNYTINTYPSDININIANILLDFFTTEYENILESSLCAFNGYGKSTYYQITPNTVSNGELYKVININYLESGRNNSDANTLYRYNQELYNHWISEFTTEDLSDGLTPLGYPINNKPYLEFLGSFETLQNYLYNLMPNNMKFIQNYPNKTQILLEILYYVSLYLNANVDISLLYTSSQLNTYQQLINLFTPIHSRPTSLVINNILNLPVTETVAIEEATKFNATIQLYDSINIYDKIVNEI